MLDWQGGDESSKTQQSQEKQIRPPTPEQKKEVQQQDDNWGNFDDDNWADFSKLEIQDTQTPNIQPVQQKSQPIIRPPTPELEKQTTQNVPVVELPKVKSIDEFLSESTPPTKQENSGGMDLFSQLEWHDNEESKTKQSPGDLANEEVKKRSRKLSIHKRSLSTSDTDEFAKTSSNLLKELFSPNQQPMQKAQMTQPNCKNDEQCCIIC